MTQSFSIMREKLRQSGDRNGHPLAISQPFAFSEELLQQFNWSPTAKIYLQAYKLVEGGLETLNTSKFTNGRGITLIAHGYLTENSILQAFPQIKSLSHKILHVCNENLHDNPCFFEGLLLAYIKAGTKRQNLTALPVKIHFNLIRTTATGFMFCIIIWQPFTPFQMTLNKQLRHLRTPLGTAHHTMMPRGDQDIP